VVSFWILLGYDLGGETEVNLSTRRVEVQNQVMGETCLMKGLKESKELEKLL
jgi:hypothetical protein